MVDRSSDRAWMPPLLNRIADIAGERAAILIGTDRACRKIHIPNTVGPGHWLAELVGLEAAQKISAEFGSQNLVIPPALKGSKRRRAQAIAALNAQGLSLNDVAAMVGVARSTVIDHRFKGRHAGQRIADPSSDDQGSLF